MKYIIYTVFGLLPSIIWLLFYLRKDSHPESNGMILKVFFYGMISALPAFFMERGFASVVPNYESIIFLLLHAFVGIAFIEEILKYLVVKFMVIHNCEFDEPIDAVLYMIIAALGFAAVENFLYLAFPGSPFNFVDTLVLSGLRFLGATLLHALCSGTIGYFIALSFFGIKNRRRILYAGILISTILHGLFNFSIMNAVGMLDLLIPALILIGLATFLSLAIQRLKKIKSVCII